MATAANMRQYVLKKTQPNNRPGTHRPGAMLSEATLNHGAIAKPYDIDSWRGRYLHDVGSPAQMVLVLFAAVNNHFHGNVREAREYFLHEHDTWRHIGGDFTQPTGYRQHQPRVGAPEWRILQRRNQCYCHGDRQHAVVWVATGRDGDQRGWFTAERDGGLTGWAYVLGDRGLDLWAPTPDQPMPWLPVAQASWQQPPPDWRQLPQLGSR